MTLERACVVVKNVYLHVCFNIHIPGEDGLDSSLLVFFSIFQQRIFEDKWHRFFYQLDVLTVG